MSSRRRQPKPFADGTPVSVEKTRAELERLVTQHGGRQYFSGWKDDHTAVIGFRSEDRIVRLELPLPVLPWRPSEEREVRRRWRCLLFALKAQFTVVETGIKTFEQAFFADIVTPTNQTVYEAAHETLAEMYRTGQMKGRLLGAVPEAPSAEYEGPRDR